MITTSTTMLYVTDTKAAMAFWTEKMGFALLKTADYGETVSYEIAPTADSAAKFGIHDKDWVARKNPGMSVAFPSLLLETDDLQAEYDRLTALGVATNPVMDYQGMRHFTFADNDGNYIAITQS